MSSEFNEMTQRLKESFNGSWLKFLFHRTALGKILNQENPPSPWNFFQTYFSSRRSTRLWFNSLNPPYSNFDAFVSCATYLKNSELYNEENVNTFSHHADIRALASMVFYLQQAEILTEANFALVTNHAGPRHLLFALFFLSQAEILTEANFALVANHADTRHLASALCSLQRAGILTEANLAVVAHAHHTDPYGWSLALTFLQQAEILTEANFAVLVAPNHASLVSEQAPQLIWLRLQRHLVTQANFERLVIASEQRDPMAELQRVVNQINAVQAQPGHAAHFNHEQSTHTASVHRSVSESARKLMGLYGHALNLEAKIAEIKAYVNGLDDSQKHSAVKLCITRITAPDYSFTDTSDVSTLQLLALAFIAIHDATKREGKLEDAKALFIDALYEIQRGYNINEQGVDDGQPDRNICHAGTFNKLMEKLNGIHTDVEIYYITADGANIKFPKLVEEYALRYLRSIASPNTLEDFQQCKAIIDRMQQDDSIAPIWDNIKDDVAREIWEEFHEAYAENPQHKSYTDLINVGWQFLEAPKKPHEIETQLLASDGCQQLLGLQMRDLFNSAKSPIMVRLHEHSLWANRQENDDAQHAFDKRFGLMIAPSK